MVFEGFESIDFELFHISGLEERMEKLISQLRPKFQAFGDQFAPELSAMVGEEMFAHVARHARRKTNPPDDSWVAFASSKRGYKMLPHFQIGLWSTHVFIQWGLIYECPHKETFAERLKRDKEDVMQLLPDNFVWYKDHMKPEGIRQGDMTETDLTVIADRLQRNKNGEVMVGITIPKEEAVTMDSEAFYQTVRDTWEKLLPLHRMARL